MRQDDRIRFDEALERARCSAYPPGEFVGQESFMTAGEIRSLAVESGIGPGVSVLDLCCGVAGPGRLITRELGCRYLGIDASASAIQVASERAHDLDCSFGVARVPPVPAGPFDVVLVLETMLAFPDKDALLRDVASALSLGGRFAFTLEAGEPLTRDERRRMPDPDSVLLIPMPALLACLTRHGLRVHLRTELTTAHRVAADALLAAFTADAPRIGEQLGHDAVDDLLAAHRIWGEWLRSGRVRKFAFVAEKI